MAKSRANWFTGTLLTLCTIGLAIAVSAQSPPGAPTGLIASITGSTVTVQWQPPAGGSAPVSYVVEAGSAAGASNIGRFPTGPSPTTLIATNVAAGTYFVRVRAVNGSGESAPSNEVVVTMGSACAAAPSAPATLTASVTGFAVQLGWGVSAGHVSSYILEAGSSPGGTDMGNFDLGTTTSYFASSVPAGTYHVRVKARNACGISGPSPEEVVTVGSTCSGPPGVPGTPAASVSGSSVQLTWGLSSGAVSTYVLEVGSTPGATNLGVYEVGTGTDYRVSGVANGTYYVRIRGRNPCGLSGPSGQAIVTVNVTPTGPPRLEIVNGHAYTIQNGQSAGQLVIAGEVVNRGGAASLALVSAEVFAPNGSRLRGLVVELIGRSRLNTNTQLIQDWSLGPGETGCFAFTIGEASTIGRYDVRTSFEADPTRALDGQLQATVSWGRQFNATGLVVEPSSTNIGPVVTTWNSVAFVAKDSGGRVLGCGYKRVYGPTNAEVPGYGLTNVLRRGETAYPLNYQPWINTAIPAASVTSVTAWPLWKE